jgi:hypothetical protein
MKKTVLLLITTFGLAAFAQTNGTIAILDFENKALLKDATIQRVGDKIRQEFANKGDYVVFDRWLIDTMISARGNKQLLKCTDESCLFAIGHLISADLVLGGSITKQNRRYCISADLVDIKSNIASGNTQSFVIDFYDTTVASAADELVNRLLELRNAKKVMPSNAANTRSSMQNQNIMKHPAVDSGQGGPLNKTTKKSGLSKSLFWAPVAAVVIGAAAAGIYYFKKKQIGSGSADNDISLDDAPMHPGTGFISKAP